MNADDLFYYRVTGPLTLHDHHGNLMEPEETYVSPRIAGKVVEIIGDEDHHGDVNVRLIHAGSPYDGLVQVIARSSLTPITSKEPSLTDTAVRTPDPDPTPLKVGNEYSVTGPLVTVDGGNVYYEQNQVVKLLKTDVRGGVLVEAIGGEYDGLMQEIDPASLSPWPPEKPVEQTASERKFRVEHELSEDFETLTIRLIDVPTDQVDQVLIRLGSTDGRRALAADIFRKRMGL